MEDRKLIELIQQDADVGIGKAMDIYGNAVNTICRCILKNAADGLVDEAVADTFYKLWRYCGNFQEKKGVSLKSYIYSIARNTAVDVWRRERNTLQTVETEEWMEMESEFSLEGEVQERLLQKVVHQLVLMLKEPDRTVFLCKYFLGMRNAEIADRLSLEGKKVENILYRGKVRLKKMLAERGITTYEEL